MNVHPFRVRINGALDSTPAPDLGLAARCPFCMDAENIVLEDEGDLYTAHCDGCGAEGPSFDDKQLAVNAWNNRSLSYGGVVASAVQAADEPDSYFRRNNVLVSIDQARGVVACISQYLTDNDGDAHAWSGLNLAVDELQRLRDEVAELLQI